MGTSLPEGIFTEGGRRVGTNLAGREGIALDENPRL